MAFEPYDYGLDVFYTSASTQALARSCDRKVEFAKLFKTKRREEWHSAAVGTCLHNGYQSWLINKDYDKAMFEMMKTYPFHLEDQDYKKERSLFACYATMDEMLRSGLFEGYEIATIKKADGTVVPAVEVAFEILLEGVSFSQKKHIPIIYRGKIDCILFNPFLNQYAAYDIKTTRSNMVDKTSMYMFDEQVLPYALVLEKLLGKHLNELQVNYISTWVDIKKPRIENYQFVKTADDIEDWARGLILDIERLRIFYDMAWFKRNPNACSNSYGRVCPWFEDVCAQRDPRIVKQIIEMGMDEKEFKQDYFGEPWVKMSIHLKEAA